jgi:hypothetical protein
MSRLVDNMIAFRILSMLVKPFKETEAFRLGIIDDKGKNLKKSYQLTSDERDAYTYLHRLAFNLKKILLKLPGGDSKLKNLVAALYLVKEYHETNNRSMSLMEDRFNKILEAVENNVYLVEEEIQVKKFFEEAPANNTAGASVTEPKIGKKDISKYQVMARRKKPINVPA